jgi:hypothetical protein
MAIDEGRRNQKNQNSRKLRKCYYHLYGQNWNITENKMSLNPYTLLAATNYTKKRAMEYGRKKVIEIAVGKRACTF